MNDLSRRDKYTLISFVLMLLMAPLLVLAVKYAQDLRSSASPQPTDIVFTNITGNSVTVTYQTDEAASGTATAGGAGGVLSGTDSRDDGTPGDYTLHHIVIGGLQADTEYDITIFSGGESFEAGKVSTLPLNEGPSTPDVIFGKISGEKIPEGIVYAVAGNGEGNTVPVSTAFKDNNTFTLDRTALRYKDGTSIDKDNVDIVLFVEGGESGREIVQFSATENPEEITLSDQNISFDPDIKIEVGGDPDTEPDPDSTPVTDPDDGDYILDNFSESLLTDTYSTGAEDTLSFAPYNIFISNITPSGFTVNWLTKQPVTGFVEIEEESQSSRIVDPRDGSIENAKRRYTHSVDAKSSSIPAGSIFNFYIISNGVAFGQNIDDTAEDYNNQFKAYAATYYAPLDKNDPANTSQQQTTPGDLTGTESVIPSFSYDPTGEEVAIPEVSGEPVTDEEDPFAEPVVDFAAIEYGAVPKAFRVIIPQAPTSAPLPVVQQGGVISVVDDELLNNQISVLARRNTSLINPEIETSRDYLVAAKTADSIWSSGTVIDSGGFNLSLGSTLTTEKDKYISIQEGDAIDVMAFGVLNQDYSSTLEYSEDPINIQLENADTMISIIHGDIVSEPLIFGYFSSAALLTIDVNGTQEIQEIKNDKSWQSLTENLEVGLNEITLEDVNGNKQSILFIVDVDELPVTGIGLDKIFIISGIVMILGGLAIYGRFGRVRKYKYHKHHKYAHT